MTGLIQEFRYALRQLRKSPGFAFTALLILTLGIAASTAIFGFVDAALIAPLPYRDPARLVEVTERAPMFPRGADLSYPDYLDWKRLNKVFSSLDVYEGTSYLVRNSARAEPVTATRVSSGFFRTLGIAPMLGRDFLPGEDRLEARPTVMLSSATWQKRFSGRHDIVGQTVMLSDVAYTIIGVLPQSFQFAPAGRSEFWTAFHADDHCSPNRDCHDLIGVARLKDGVSVAAALADVQTIARQLEIQYPASNRGQGAFVVPLSEQIVYDVRPVLLVLLSGAGLLLIIACVNVSSLLLVRSESRKREMAVRSALGAPRLRLLRQFAVEGLGLAGAAWLSSLAAAQAAMRLLASMVSTDMMDSMPYLEGLTLNRHTLTFAGANALGAAILFSIVPALRWSMAEIKEGLSEGGRGYAGTLWRRFGTNLVAAELATAMILLVGAGLLGKSFYRLLHVDVGFETDHLATLRVALPEEGYSKDEQQVAAARQMLSRIGSLPGVQSVGISSILPVSYNGGTTWIRILGQPYNGEHNEVIERHMSSAFFPTLRTRLLRGRYFSQADDASKPRVVMINRALAQKYFAGEDPLGKKIAEYDLAPDSISEIIGVVDDVKDGPLDSETWPAMYRPFNQRPNTYFSVVARTSQDEASLLPAMVAAVREIDPGIGSFEPSTMAGRIDNSPSAYLHRSSAWLVGGFACVALLLGVVGLYGVIAYSVGRRTREIGVRIALGAQRRSVYHLIMKEAAGLILVGIAAGLVGSIGAATLIRSLLFGVRLWDEATLASVSAVLALSALMASYIPARRAASVDPMVALRYE
jgi:macrolide transport system ATP-binding/permease protein